MTKGFCGRCTHFDPVSVDPVGHEIKTGRGPRGWGACRRFPPTITRFDAGRDRYVGAQPVVTEWGSCGEFKEHVLASEAAGITDPKGPYWDAVCDPGAT